MISPDAVFGVYGGICHSPSMRVRPCRSEVKSVSVTSGRSVPPRFIFKIALLTENPVAWPMIRIGFRGSTMIVLSRGRSIHAALKATRCVAIKLAVPDCCPASPTSDPVGVQAETNHRLHNRIAASARRRFSTCLNIRGRSNQVTNGQ